MKNPLLILLLLISLNIFSQNPWQGGGQGGKGGNMKEMMERMKVGHFYGKIVDSTTNKGVEFVSVQLLGNVYDTVTKTVKKDVVVAGQLTEVNGDFSLEKLAVMGKYKIRISALGYLPVEFPVSFNFDMESLKGGGGGGAAGAMGMLNAVDKDLGNIKIKAKATQLKEVTVEASAPVLELKLDKKVFNVEKNMVSTGGTAEDVLKQVPTVSVDVDGNVSLRNAAPQIFVDGKPTTLTIDQIPADAIQSIEIITNPSAKYDASGGMGGILNIVLKKERRMGYNGNLRLGIDQYAKINAGADINARENKINVFLSGNFNQRYSITNGTTDRENLIGFPRTNIFQDQHSINNGQHIMGRGGFDWFMNNRNTFTLSGIYVSGAFKPEDDLDARTDTVYSSYTNSSNYNRVSATNRSFANKGGSLQYKHLFPKEGQEWTADMNYNKSTFTSGGDYTTNYFDGNGNATGAAILQNMKGNGYNEMFNGQTDLILPLKEKSKIETGIRGSYKNFHTKTENFIKNDSTGEFDLIKNQSNNYAFIDQIYAGYATYSKQKNKLSFQLGMRLESSFYKGELIDSNKTFTNYFPISLFPSGSATYDVNGKDNFQFSYSRRINRPSFFQLIPFTDYSDSLNLRKGNASLKPEFTHSLELSYLKTINQANNLLTTFYFKNATDLITNFQNLEYDSVLKKPAIITTYENANASYVYGGELTSKHSIKKWLEFTLNFNVYYSIIDAKNLETSLTNEQFSWFTKENITFKLPKNFSIQLSPEYRSKSSLPVNRGDGGGRFGMPGGGGGGGGGWMGGSPATAQGYIKEKYSVDAAVKFEFMKNKAASITINMRDIFATDKNVTVSNSDFFNQTSSRVRDPRFVRINFSYRFGKFDTSIFKRKNMKMNMDGMDMGM